MTGRRPDDSGPVSERAPGTTPGGPSLPSPTGDQLTEREAVLFERTRRETLLDIRAEFARYAVRPGAGWRGRVARAHARWAAAILGRMLDRLERIAGPVPTGLPPSG
jgi:hypothetical protein